MIYPKDFENKIGFDAIRSVLSDFCDSALGKAEVMNMTFSSDLKTIKFNLSCVNEMVDIHKNFLPYSKPSSINIIPFLNELKAANSFVSAEKLFKILTVIDSFGEIRNFFDNQVQDETPIFVALNSLIRNLKHFSNISKSISYSINKFGEIKDSASPELYNIRQNIKIAQGSVHSVMRRIMEKAISSGIIESDVSHSVRDGRLVIPVVSSKKRLINGIIHDESATGKTVYIEPAEVVEASNHLRELRLDEKREETKILISISDIIRPYIDDIEKSCYILGKLDFIDAKAKFALEYNASLPHISDCPELEWYGAVHPGLMMSLKESGRKVVPLTLHLEKSKRILIISGPNAGGKSVTLKTVACVQYMFQCGVLPTLNYNSHMGIFKNIFIDIGDEQSFENDLSTYSSHLRNMKFFLQYATRATLVLADEMGSGTEPLIGGALAQSILAKLGIAGCFGIITTHYQNLKTFAETTPGFVNGAMLYDRAKLEPTFQLSVGNAGSSFAFDIAYKMGLPKEVIDSAKEIAGEDSVNMDKYLSDIARDKKYWANKRQNIKEKESKLDNLIAQYEQEAQDLSSKRINIIKDAEKEAKTIIDSANAKIERTILEIRKVQAEKEKTKALRKELNDFSKEKKFDDNSNQKNTVKITESKLLSQSKKRINKEKKSKLSKLEEIASKKIEPGDFVKLDNGNSVGQVISISNSKADVAFGLMRMQVNLSRLKITSKPKQSSANANVSVSLITSADSRERQLNFKNEIDVRGMRGDEAIQAITYFIDDALQFNATRVRILHGTGHGILKTLIRQQLSANPAVTNFEDEDIRFGGAGITVVDL